MKLKENWYTFKGGKSVKIILPPFWKGAYYNRKILFIVGPFWEGDLFAGNPLHKMTLLYQVYPVPLKFV